MTTDDQFDRRIVVANTLDDALAAERSFGHRPPAAVIVKIERSS